MASLQHGSARDVEGKVMATFLGGIAFAVLGPVFLMVTGFESLVPAQAGMWIAAIYAILFLSLMNVRTRAHAITAILCTWLVVSGADLAFTIAYIVPGVLKEVSPLVRWIIEHMGIRGLIAFKVLMTILPTWFLLWAKGRASVGRWAMVIAIVTGGLVVVWWQCLAFMFVRLG